MPFLVKLTIVNKKKGEVMKKWKKEDIKSILESRDEAILKGMLRIFDCQTEDEKHTDDTHVNNGIGFTGADAFILSKFSKFFNDRKYLTEKQFAIAKKRMIKYAGQLAKIANGEISVPQRVIVIPANWLRPSKPKKSAYSNYGGDGYAMMTGNYK